MAALLTPLVGLLSVLIGVLTVLIYRRQWQTAQDKLKFDLFDRRFEIDDAARNLIGSITKSAGCDQKILFKFDSETREAKWLLDEGIDRYLYKELSNKGNKYRTLSDDPIQNVEKQLELQTWFREQYKVLDFKFAPFLKIKHLNLPIFPPFSKGGNFI